MQRITKKIQQNPQHLFQFVIAKLWQQGYRSIDNSGMCRYKMTKGGNTIGCAVGVVMPDRIYSSALEKQGFWSLLKYVELNKKDYPELVEWVEGFSESATTLLGKLQTLHDHTIKVNKNGKFNKRSFYQSVKIFAEENQLNAKFLEKLCKGGATK